MENELFSTNEGWQGRAIAVTDSVPPPPAKTYARAKLQTASDIARELGKLYRLAKSGEMDASLATKLTYILQTMAKIQVDSELEQRLSALENRN